MKKKKGSVFSGKAYERIKNIVGKGIKSAEEGWLVSASAFTKLKHSMPSLHSFCSYFENMAKSHFVSSKVLEKKPSIANFGKVITSRIASILPHVELVQIKGMGNSKSSHSFFDAMAKGLGIGKKKGIEYAKLRKNHLFKRVLIANRGEIALRIIGACRELGVESVALYSKQEKNSLVVKFADKSYSIGASKNYLDIKKIVEIAKKVKADAIHPGYGFLSENADFAKLCEKRRIKFIGPTSKMISVLGNKVEAKKSMISNGVPVIEGERQSLKDLAHAKETAKSIGYPLIIKASAGGGGKGLRIVRKEEEIEQAFNNTKAESKNAFGDDSVYMEKYVEEPRHIEFQILADKYGNVIHLGERDCTIQRRHQKLVEEAPSPALTNELRQIIGESAVRAVKAIKYEGAGTVEFLLDKSGKFYFIEMNTRIQVEHGVTEMVTGVDLVKEQIKLATGAKLSHKQEKVKIDGWAVECRINAEDPAENFMPSMGTIMNYLPPGGPGIRISSSCHAGHKIEPHFDSLIGLLICHGATRVEAIARMSRALEEYSIEGVKTTIPFHKAVINHPEFLKGNVTTSFIDKYGILEQVRKGAEKNKNGKAELPADKKILIVTAAVNQYLAKKGGFKANGSKMSPWINAARQEAMRERSLEE